MAKDNPETNPITIKPETGSHVAEQFSWVPLPYCFPPGCPFPIKSLALSADVSPRTIHFRVLDKSPVSALGRGPLSCNSTIHSKSLDKHMMMLPSLYHHTDYFHYPKHLCTTFSPGKHLFYCPHSFTFPRMSYSWNHTICRPVSFSRNQV